MIFESVRAEDDIQNSNPAIKKIKKTPVVLITLKNWFMIQDMQDTLTNTPC